MIGLLEGERLGDRKPVGGPEVMLAQKFLGLVTEIGQANDFVSHVAWRILEDAEVIVADTGLRFDGALAVATEEVARDVAMETGVPPDAPVYQEAAAFVCRAGLMADTVAYCALSVTT